MHTALVSLDVTESAARRRTAPQYSFGRPHARPQVRWLQAVGGWGWLGPSDLCGALLLILAFCSAVGCNHRRAVEDATPSPALGPPPKPYLLHLPGIGGARRVDRMLTEGLVQGGIDADVQIHDWTGRDEGMNALYARERHQREAEIVAQMITEKLRADPRTKIYLSGHSGGTGIAVWALELLPDDVKVESLLLLASALSPGYDLSPALRHVRGKAYVLYSAFDPILGVGTRMFGTIDGVKADGAGRVGFTKPNDAADPMQYDKLVQIAYDPSWIKLNNVGDHIGVMMRPFAREILSPLLRTGVLREITRAATRPTTLPATTRAAHSGNAQALRPGLLRREAR